MGRPRSKANKKYPPRFHYKADKGLYFHVALVAGERKWTSLGKDEAKAMMAYRSLEQGTPAPAVLTGTVMELVERYLRDGTRGLAPATIRHYRDCSVRPLKVFG